MPTISTFIIIVIGDHFVSEEAGKESAGYAALSNQSTAGMC